MIQSIELLCVRKRNFTTCLQPSVLMDLRHVSLTLNSLERRGDECGGLRKITIYA